MPIHRESSPLIGLSCRAKPKAKISFIEIVSAFAASLENSASRI